MLKHFLFLHSQIQLILSESFAVQIPWNILLKQNRFDTKVDF